MKRVTISSVSDRGTHPLFTSAYEHEADIAGYVNMWTHLADRAGVAIKITTEEEPHAMGNHDARAEDSGDREADRAARLGFYHSARARDLSKRYHRVHAPARHQGANGR